MRETRPRSCASDSSDDNETRTFFTIADERGSGSPPAGASPRASLSSNSRTIGAESCESFTGPKAAIRGDSRTHHRVGVRLAHWVIALGVVGLMETGVGILISHPRLYWGETGGVDTPSLINLPLPMIIGPSVWNRPIHFLFAWLLLFGWIAYIAAGVATRHIRNDLLPFDVLCKNMELRRAYDATIACQISPDDYRKLLESAIAEERENPFSTVGIPLLVEMIDAQVPADALAKVHRRFRLLDRAAARIRQKPATRSRNANSGY